MSRDVKRMRRKLLREAAKMNRAESRGAGQGRKTIRHWTWAMKADLYEAYVMHTKASRGEGGTDSGTPSVPGDA